MRFILIVIFTVGIVAVIILWNNKSTPSVSQNSELSTTMTIKSSAFGHGGVIPVTYTCDGKNINPPLEIAGVPQGAKSLVLIVDDPDAPAGTWIHWTVWNMDPETSVVAENSAPAGATEGTTSFGKPGYGSPCPPSGRHRYFFKLYALDTTFHLGSQTTATQLAGEMDRHILATAELMGTYERIK